MRLLIKIFLIFAFLAVPPNAYAQPKHPKKVAAFKKAVKEKNKKTIRKLVLTISRDKKSVKYMKDNLPRYFIKYKLWKTAMDLRDISGEDYSDGTGTLNRSKGDGTDTRQLANSSANQSRFDNGAYVRETLNQDRISNSDIADGSSNRNLLSNQERLRSGSRRR